MSFPGLRHFVQTVHKRPYPAIDPTQPALSAEGKTVLITAGHTGIGRAISDNFGAARAANVVLVARRQEVLDQAAAQLGTAHPHTKYHTYAASVTDHARLKEVFADVRATIGEIDVLVTSAAGLPRRGLTLELSEQDLRDGFELNVVGNMNVVREFLKDRKADPRDKVIVDVSTGAAHFYTPGRSVYSATKHSFSQLLQHLQADDAYQALRVYSFHPGSVFSDMARSYGMKEGDLDWDDANLPGRFAVWLASHEADFLKGRYLWAAWDVDEMKAKKPDLEKEKDLLTLGLKGFSMPYS